MYSNNPHTQDELRHNIYETVTPVKASKLKLTSIFPRDFSAFKGIRGDFLASTLMVSSSKQFIYFKKCKSIFIMRGILAAHHFLGR
jgi:hypothetical protein